MKKLLTFLSALLLAFPLSVLAYAIPMFATTTTGTIFSFPNSVNGTFPNVMSPFFFATSTTASTFPYASTTALTALTICLTGDTCRTTWPTGGSGAWPFTTGNTNFGVAVQSTTTPEWFQNGVFASSTSRFATSSADEIWVATSSAGIGLRRGLVMGLNKSIILTSSLDTNNYVGGIQFYNTSTTSKTGLEWYDATGTPVAWILTHYSNPGDTPSNHQHIEIETSDTSNQKQGRLTVGYNCDYDCLITMNQAEVQINRNSGQTNGNLLFNGGGQLRNTGTMTVIPNNALNTAGFSIATSTSGHIAISENGGNTIDVLDNLRSTNGIFATGTLAITGNTTLYGNASTSILSADTLCFTGDTCRTTWPTSGSGAWPFTTGNTNFGVAVQSTTTPEWFQNGLFASSTSQFVEATTSSLGILNLAGAGNNFLIVRNSGNVDKITLPLTVSNGGTGTSTWQTNSIPYYNGTRLTEGNSALNFNGSLLTATNASTTNLSTSNKLWLTGLTGQSCIGTDGNGLVGAGSCGGGGAWPFTPSTNFGTAVQSTSTPIWGTAGLQASSTSQFLNQNIWGNLTLKATSSALLATDSAGNIIATTSVGVNYLTGILPIANGGTNASSIGSHMLTAFDGTRIVSTSTPTMAAFIATSTTATSTIANALEVGPHSSSCTGENKLCVISPNSSWNDYMGIWVQNTTNGSTASTDIVAGNDNTDPLAYVDLGANSTGNTNASFSAFGKGDAYLFSNTGLGNLVIANASSTKSLLFASGGLLSTNIRMAIAPAGNVGVGTTSPTAKLSVHLNNGETNKYAFTIASSTASATTTLLSVDNTGVGSLSIGSSTQTFSAGTGLLTLGNTSSGTSTVSMGKVQFDGYNTAGTRICIFVVGTTLTIGSGACTQ